MRVRTTNHCEFLPRVRQTDPTIDWETCPGYQQHLIKNEQEMKHKQDTLTKEKEEQESREYSCEHNIEEEIELPELDDQKPTTKTNNEAQNDGQQQQNNAQPGQQIDQKENDPMDESESPPKKTLCRHVTTRNVIQSGK